MRPSQVRYVTACQQLLALGVVLAVLAPAATVISLDVVISQPGAAPASATRSDARAALVPEGPVDAVVEEYSLTASQGSGAGWAGQGALGAAVGRTELRGRPETVDGFGTVGVTWRRH